MNRYLPGVALLALVTVGDVAAQDPARFEVASIRPNRSGDSGSFFQVLPGGRFLAVNATAIDLVRSAYAFEFEPFQIVGDEPWMRAERYDVDARAGRDMPPPQVGAMVAGLLSERFAMVTRRETREMPAYALVSLRPGASLGPRLRPAVGECAVFRLGLDGLPIPPPPDLPTCGVRGGSSAIANGVRATGTHVTIAQLASRLRQYLQRMVIDDTNLAGMFEADLEFSDPRRSLVAGSDATPDAALSVFTAVEEQLGLRLEPRYGPVEVLVIESVQRPTEN